MSARSRFRRRFGYPFNLPTVRRELYLNDRSVETTLSWTLLYRRLTISYSRPLRGVEIDG